MAETLVASALHLVGFTERWVQKRIVLLDYTNCARTYRFEILLLSRQVIAECIVWGLEEVKDSGTDLSGNKTHWDSGEVEFKNVEGARKFQGWLLPTGAVYIQAVKRLLWGKCKTGRIPNNIQVTQDEDVFPYADCRSFSNGSASDAETLEAALGDYLLNYCGELGIELIQTEFKGDEVVFMNL